MHIYMFPISRTRYTLLLFMRKKQSAVSAKAATFYSLHVGCLKYYKSLMRFAYIVDIKKHRYSLVIAH